MKKKGPSKIQTLKGFAIALIFFGGISGVLGGFKYLMGNPEYYGESRTGTYHVEAKPAGDPISEFVMVAGGVVCAFGGFVYAGLFISEKIVIMRKLNQRG